MEADFFGSGVFRGIIKMYQLDSGSRLPHYVRNDNAGMTTQASEKRFYK